MKVQDKLDEVKHYLSDSYGITTRGVSFTIRASEEAPDTIYYELKIQFDDPNLFKTFGIHRSHNDRYKTQEEAIDALIDMLDITTIGL